MGVLAPSGAYKGVIVGVAQKVTHRSEILLSSFMPGAAGHGRRRRQAPPGDPPPSDWRQPPAGGTAAGRPCRPGSGPEEPALGVECDLATQMGTEDIAAGRNLPALHEVDQPGQGPALVDRPGRGGGRWPDGFRRRPGGTPTRAAMRCRLSPSRYINTHSASGARRNRLSMMDPILPRPTHQAGGRRGTIATAFGRPLARLAARAGVGGRRRALPCPNCCFCHRQSLPCRGGSGAGLGQVGDVSPCC
ncbi:hypothetical protein M2428_001064 [Arthrobacter sp. ES3-54]|nr:hypothetical protein [Arthrobacter sp. ES3-54]